MSEEKVNVTEQTVDVAKTVEAIVSGQMPDVTEIKVMADQATDFVMVYGFQFVAGLALLIGGLYLSKMASRLTIKALSKFPKFDETLKVFFASLARYFVIVITVLVVLSQFGVETASLIAVFGAASLAIGLALQGTLSNVAAGVMLLIFRPFKVGDFIEAGGVSGTAKEINLFFTRVHTPDNILIIVPNSDIWGKAVKNFSVNPKRRVDLVFGIGYGADINKAIKAIEAVIEKEERIDTSEAPSITVASLGESSVDLSVKVWVKRTDFLGVKSDMQKNVKEAFDKKKIDIPFPSRTIYTVAAK